MKYPKLTVLLFTYLLAIAIFRERIYLDFLYNLGYFGTFLAGIFYDYGLTSGIATAVLMIFGKGQNIFIAGIIGGLGALIGDFIIFKFLKYSFRDELVKLSKTWIFKETKIYMPKFLMYTIACILVASPLPDEICMFFFASLFKIKDRYLVLIFFILNTLGIYAIMLIGRAI
ncbi:hypothetical protein J4405_04425 [Candidatus Woesearchaeota archaeon]|nr:hypothetical protein [Candidatus Woesearchaeota archaeon]